MSEHFPPGFEPGDARSFIQAFRRRSDSEAEAVLSGVGNGRALRQ